MYTPCCLLLFFWLLLIKRLLSNSSMLPLINSNSQHTYIGGDIMLGGLSAIHDAGGVNNLKCDNNISSYGIQRLEAMRYAVNEINKDNTLLRGLKLGIEIRDSCGSETKALDESLQFVISRVPVCNHLNNTNPFFGVVGASMSLLTSQVANLLRLFKIPLVSYGATSVELSNKSKYDFLLRTVPPDSFQSDAMVDFIAQELNWKSVFVLYSEGSYGEHGFATFVKSISKRSEYNICIVDSKKINAGSTVDALQEILKTFKNSEPGIRGIVSYCETPDVHSITKAIQTLDLVDHFRIIGSDVWVTSKTLNNSIIFSLHYNSMYLEDFYKTWYKKLNPKTVSETENPWFEDFWISACKKTQKLNPSLVLNCTNFDDTLFSLCKDSKPRTIEATCRRDDKISYTIDAVYAYAHAINELYVNQFNSNKSELKKVDLTSRIFMDDFLSKVNFTGVSGPIFFPDDDKTSRGFYDLNQYNEHGVLERIGTWNSGNLKVQKTWQKTSRPFFLDSYCQQICANNEKRVITSKSCCWRCKQCKKNEYLFKQDTCFACQPGTKPNSNYTGCFDLPIKHIETGWKIMISVFVALGIFLTLFTMATFIRYIDTPLVRASGRELSFMILTGILLLYLISCSLIIYPTSFSCGIGRFSIGLSLGICYGSLLTKTNRIARIFSGRQGLLFLSPHWQVMLTLFLLTPQILIGIIGIVRDRPKPIIVTKFEDYRIIKCNSETPDLIGSISYNLILVVFCTYYAFKTRKVPSNFNEARFIGFVMYTTCVLWVAFIPVFVGTSEEYRTIFIVLDLMINATTLLVGLFGIKIYIILLRPDKNTRSNSKLRASTFLSGSSYVLDGRETYFERYTNLPSPIVLYNNKKYKDKATIFTNGHKYNDSPNGKLPEKISPMLIPTKSQAINIHQRNIQCNSCSLKLRRLSNENMSQVFSRRKTLTL